MVAQNAVVPNAVVRIKGVQYRVAEGDILDVPLVGDEAGATIELGEVLMLGGDSPVVGTPLVDGARVTAEVVGHGRGDKILVFRFKRRKNYRRTTGHRQDYTRIRITGIQA